MNLAIARERMLARQVARDPDAAAQIGVIRVYPRVDDRDRHAAPRGELVGFLDVELDGRGLEADVRIVVARALRLEHVHVLHDVDTRIGGDRGDHGVDVAVARHD